MKYLLIMLFLVSCGVPPTLTKTEVRVYIPNDAYFKCPVLAQYPDASKLTDKQVAELLVKLDTNNKTCRNSLNTVKQLLNNASKKFRVIQ